MGRKIYQVNPAITQAVHISLRYILVFAFFASSLPKISDPLGFLEAIFAYELVAGDVAVAVSAFLPWLELFMAVALFINIFKRESSVYRRYTTAWICYRSVHSINT